MLLAGIGLVVFILRTWPGGSMRAWRTFALRGTLALPRPGEFIAGLWILSSFSSEMFSVRRNSLAEHDVWPDHARFSQRFMPKSIHQLPRKRIAPCHFGLSRSDTKSWGGTLWTKFVNGLAIPGWWIILYKQIFHMSSNFSYSSTVWQQVN